ncbi:MAG: histidine ammonia-lyase [Bacteroidales bacterium]
MEIFEISLKRDSIFDLEKIIDGTLSLSLSAQAKEKIVAGREYLESRVKVATKPIYGITTGFGSLYNISVENESLSRLQSNLMMSHACGIGDLVPIPIVKLMMVLKIKSLSYGLSGVRLETVERLIELFNHQIWPVVYTQGSLGASGDLAPLANMSLPLIGEGEVLYKGERVRAAKVLAKLNIKPLSLASKEGLALLNGTQFMLAYAVWNSLKIAKLYRAANKIAALSLDAFNCSLEPFHPALHKVRPHKGQQQCAQEIVALLKESQIAATPNKEVQDPYSFRCIPQIHGATKDTLDHAISIFETEINSVTDNPTLLPHEDLIVSAGNFHGQPLALPLDFLSIAAAELGSVSERRTYQLISGKRELPSFLIATPGLNSGFMITQYAQASVVSENKQLSTPASVDTIDSSQGQEDHVSMGANAATKCYRVVENLEKILAIELFNAAQAIEFRREGGGSKRVKSSPQIEKLLESYRGVVPFIEKDQVMYTHIDHTIKFLRESKILNE